MEASKAILRSVADKHAKDVLVTDNAIHITVTAKRDTKFFYCLVCRDFIKSSTSKSRGAHFLSVHKNLPLLELDALRDICYNFSTVNPVIFDIKEAPAATTEAEKRIHQWYIEKLWFSGQVVRNMQIVEDISPPPAVQQPIPIPVTSTSAPPPPPLLPNHAPSPLPITDATKRKRKAAPVAESSSKRAHANSPLLRDLQKLTETATNFTPTMFDTKLKIQRTTPNMDNNGLPVAMAVSFATSLLKDPKASAEAKKAAKDTLKYPSTMKISAIQFIKKFAVEDKKAYTIEDFKVLARKQGSHVVLFYRKPSDRHYEIVHEENVGKARKMYLALNEHGVFDVFNPIAKYLQGTLCHTCAGVYRNPHGHDCASDRVDLGIDIACLSKLTAKRPMPLPKICEDVKPDITDLRRIMMGVTNPPKQSSHENSVQRSVPTNVPSVTVKTEMRTSLGPSRQEDRKPFPPTGRHSNIFRSQKLLRKPKPEPVW